MGDASEDEDDDFDDDEPETKHNESTMARELLASFYGQLQRPPPTENVEEVPEIDRTEFDAESYVRNMLTTQPLESLLRVDEKLCRESKSLGSEMQMLVYENYSKFISATDTIREMRTNVRSMEQEMTALTSTMSEIETMSGVVNASLADKRAQIDKLVRTRRTLKRLEFLFDLPRKLESAIAAGAYEEAVKYHRVTEDILGTYSHIASLKAIHAESKALVLKLRTSLRASLASGPVDPVLLASRAKLLGQLGSDEKEAAGVALAALSRALQQRLEAAIAHNEDGALIGARVAAIGESFVPALAATAEAFENSEESEQLALTLFKSYFDAVEKALTTKEEPQINDQEVAVENAKLAASAFAMTHSAVEAAATKTARPELRRAVREMTSRAANKHLHTSLLGLRRSALSRLASTLFDGLLSIDFEPELLSALRTWPRTVAEGLAGDVVEALRRTEPLLAFLAYEEEEEEPGLVSSRAVVLGLIADFLAWFATATLALVGAPRRLAPPDQTATAGICEAPPLFEALCDEVGALEAKAAFSAAKAEVKGDFAERSAILALAAAATMQRLGESCAKSAIHVTVCDLRNCVDANQVGLASQSLLEHAIELSRCLLCRRATDDVLLGTLADCLVSLGQFAKRAGAALDPRDATRAAPTAPLKRPMPRPATTAVARRSHQPAGIELDVERLFAEAPTEASSTKRRSQTPISVSSSSSGSVIAPSVFAAYPATALASGAFTRQDAARALMRPLAKTLVEGVWQSRLLPAEAARLEGAARTLHEALTLHIVDVEELTDLDVVIADLLRNLNQRTLAA